MHLQKNTSNKAKFKTSWKHHKTTPQLIYKK
jgi:hypothetical protein